MQFLNTYIEQDREGESNRIIEQRCICNNTGRVIEREITRYYPNCDRLIHYIMYSYGLEVLSFYNNSNDKAVRVEFIKDDKGYKLNQTIYGSQCKVNGVDVEGYKLINQIINKLKNDKHVDFKKLYEEF